MKKVVTFLILCFHFSFVEASYSLKEDMIPNSNTMGIESEGTGVISEVLIYIKDFLFEILWIVAVGVFLYIGFQLITAKGNEEEFKKALMRFLYAIIGLAIIPLAWSAVKIVSTLKF